MNRSSSSPSNIAERWRPAANDGFKPDFLYSDQDKVSLLQPLTAAGREWLNDNVQAEGWQFFGNALAIELRYVPGVIEGAITDGLEIGYYVEGQLRRVMMFRRPAARRFS